jgi:hypothetical protein
VSIHNVAFLTIATPMMTFTLAETECGRARRLGIVASAQPLASRLTPVRRETVETMADTVGFRWGGRPITLILME